jgi:hypothetical protein
MFTAVALMQQVQAGKVAIDHTRHTRQASSSPHMHAAKIAA